MMVALLVGHWEQLMVAYWVAQLGSRWAVKRDCLKAELMVEKMVANSASWMVGMLAKMMAVNLDIHLVAQLVALMAVRWVLQTAGLLASLMVEC